MRKTIITVITVFLACFCFVNEAKASEFVGVYVGAGTNFQNTINANFGFKLRYLKYCPFGFEMVNMLPNGTELALPLYLVHHPNFKFHVVLPFTGIQIPWRKTRMSVNWLKRENFGKTLDLVMGAGVEAQFKARGLAERLGFRYFSINLDWRMFAPSPLWVVYNFGDLGRAIYRQSAKEAQIWAGITYWY